MAQDLRKLFKEDQGQQKQTMPEGQSALQVTFGRGITSCRSLVQIVLGCSCQYSRSFRHCRLSRATGSKQQ